MIRLVKRTADYSGHDGGPVDEYYIMVPGEDGPDGSVASWEAHKVSHRQLERLYSRIGDELEVED